MGVFHPNLVYCVKLIDISKKLIANPSSVFLATDVWNVSTKRSAELFEAVWNGAAVKCGVLLVEQKFLNCLKVSWGRYQSFWQTFYRKNYG